MTPEQDRQFDIFGCAARCLMAIANASRAGLTKAAFIDRYVSRYWIGSDKCGGLTQDQIKEVAIDLGLAKSIKDSKDFGELRSHIRNQSVASILMITEKKYEPNGQLSIYYHCTLVSPATIQGDDLLYLPELDYLAGTARGQYLPEAFIVPLMPTFLLLQQ